MSDCDTDFGLQKYLDGYEISPHPDIRKKALTFMINVNPNKRSEIENIHTHLLKFKPEYSYVSKFWQYNTEIERDWVPWQWCTTEKLFSKNNSIIIFKPSDISLHAVRAEYEHYDFQRTQFYGNLWFNQDTSPEKFAWSELNLRKKSFDKSSNNYNDEQIHAFKKGNKHEEKFNSKFR
tara:strand:- start:193 stop:726 length:534 start_codon:yes stop_codon:yes gene_type:complete